MKEREEEHRQQGGLPAVGTAPKEPLSLQGLWGTKKPRGRNERKTRWEVEKGGHSRDNSKRFEGAAGRGCLYCRMPYNRP